MSALLGRTTLPDRPLPTTFACKNQKQLSIGRVTICYADCESSPVSCCLGAVSCSRCTLGHMLQTCKSVADPAAQCGGKGRQAVHIRQESNESQIASRRGQFAHKQQGRAGQVQGRAGAGQGRAGQGRARQGRAGQKREHAVMLLCLSVGHAVQHIGVNRRPSQLFRGAPSRFARHETCFWHRTGGMAKS